MTDRELFKMALDALEHFEDEYGWGMQQKKAQRNLQIRLAQPEPYPENFIDALRFDAAQSEPTIDGWPLYSGLPQPEPEPAATQYKYIDAHGKDYWTSEPWEGKKVEAVRYLYTAPPQREWVGLTDKDREWCDEHSHGNTSWAKQKAYGRAIEAKLKEKNNG